jgi:type IV pilus assembly protein PilY1
MFESKMSISKPTRGTLIVAAVLGASSLGASPPPVLAGASPIAIAEYPLTVVVPAHPQVVLAVGNSQSMDGDLSGAIWTGSGGLAANLSGLQSSSSLVNYTVPASFTAPVTGTVAGGSAPYTSTISNVEYDNSASRLNVAKAGITSILSTFLATADFGLIDYQTSGNSEYATWVYYMSQAGGFTFTNSQVVGTTYVANPCYNIPLDTVNPVDSACKSLATRYASINTFKYMAIADSSDEPSISDVLYAPGSLLSPVFVQYPAPSPSNPYTGFSLSQYNNGNVSECYSNTLPSQGFTFCETPTNAGFVPFTPEVMNAQRGFGYLTSGQTAAPSSLTSWPMLVNMTSAGQSPTTASINTAIAKFSSYLAPETNSVNTGEIKAQATQSPIAGLLKASQDYFTSANPASSNGCSPNRYVVLVTDGLPTMDLNGKAWPPLGSSAATGYGVTVTFNGDGSLASTNSQALTDTITTIGALKAANIKTYIIGLGAGVANTAGTVGQTLTSMAVAGGTNAFYSAQSATQLQAAMQQILGKILAETAATAASSVNSTGVNTKSIAFQGKFTTSDTFQDWTGDLDAFPIDPKTGQINTATSSEVWSAQTQLDAQNFDTGRLITTWDPVAGAGIAFRWGTNPALTGINSGSNIGKSLQTFAQDMSGSDVLNFLRGSNAQEVRNGGQFRNRTHKLGDIVDSSPLYVGPPASPWQAASYFTFAATNRNRPPMLYVGANDGMLHAFDAATGNEKFAFIPNAVFSNLIKLVNPYYNSQHWFFVDGAPNAADVQFTDGSWHTVLLGSESAGGNSIFELDVTDPSKLTTEAQVASAALWEFTDTNMGYSFSTPSAVLTNAGFAIMFGNGYDSTNSQPVLYAVDPKTGKSLISGTTGGLNLCSQVPTACNAALPNGLSTITAVNTSGLLSAPANVVYAGDLQGNLWRVDISNVSPAKWTATVLFQARDGSTTPQPQPITVQPSVSLNPLAPMLTGVVVFFGTGEFLSVSDLSNTQTQSIYGVFDAGTASATPLTRSSLVQQTMTAVSALNPRTGLFTSVRELSANPVSLPSKSGWFVDLNLLSGERDVTAPTIFNGTVQLVTYQPNPSPCTAGGQSFLMVFNYATGGATTLPQFDWTGGTTISNATDLVNGNVVSGLSLGTSYAAAPKLVTEVGGAIAYTTNGSGENSNGTCTSIPGTTSCIPGWTNKDSTSHGAWQEVR